MPAQHQYALDYLVAEIQHKWGRDAIQTLGEFGKDTDVAPLLTGLPELDTAVGGIPVHALTLLRGAPTSGTTSVAYNIMAQAQRQSHVVAYIDSCGTFDGQYATEACEVQENQLLHIQPASFAHGLEVTRDLVSLHSRGLIVLDMGLPEAGKRFPANDFVRTLRSTSVILKRSAWTVIIILPPAMYLACEPFAALVLSFAWMRWIERNGYILGYSTCVTVQKHQQPAGQKVTLSINRDGVRS
jgi:hypothetical protein